MQKKSTHRAYGLKLSVVILGFVALLASEAHAVTVSLVTFTDTPSTGLAAWGDALQARDLDGNASTTEAFYDTVNDVTWLANPNASAALDLNAAIQFVSSLNVSGVTGWQLPTNTQFSALFSTVLGNKSATCSNYGVCTVSAGEGLTHTAPFQNQIGGTYWSSDAISIFNDLGTSSTTTDLSVTYDFSLGISSYKDASTQLGTWALHSGSVGTPITVPEPQTWVLTLLGLTAIGFARRYSKR